MEGVKQSEGASSEADASGPGIGGPPIDMTIRLVNNIQEPFFEYVHRLEGWRQKKLIYALEAAADVDEHFR